MRYGLASAAVLGLAMFFACTEDESPPAAQPDGGNASSSSSSSGDLTPPADDDDDGEPSDAGPIDAGVPFKAYDVNHVLSTGQSLSVGARGTPPLSTTQPFANLKLEADAFAPLVETTVETMSSAFANLVTQIAADEAKLGDHDLLVTVHGVGGFSYAQLKKGTTPYANGVAQVKIAADLAKSLGKTHVVRAVTNVHGETDHNLKSLTYQADITEWQADYEADVKAITGQSEPIPMLHTQMSSFTKLGGAGGSAVSRIPIDQLAVHVASNGKSVLVGPKYHLPYVSDGVHLTNEGYRHMGEDYAKVYRRIVLEGKRWEPLRPIAVTRAGKTITVKFLVPSPPLVLDDVTVQNPADYGFEIAQDGAPPPNIESVDVTAPDTVTLLLAAEPTGQNRRLRYAFTGTPAANGGPTTGARGNLRDSDATKSRAGYNLWNWCVHFDEALP
ncbi:MAG: hypothetical protein KIT84_32020 [Labilithrix sp.]|nr:hypothetical protein [Labilithrix sp.]MCW5815699.1 hypothetical protein [Labilithrix sp.]